MISAKRTIAVIGGGITGIAAALELAKSGQFEVSIFESADRLGGMSSCYTWNETTWDRFYHVILSLDEDLLGFIDEIGLAHRIFWEETKSGFFREGQLASISTTMDFIRFPFLSLWQKFRLGLGILYSTRIKNPERLDRIYVKQWLTKVFGRGVYERMWDPLLRSKLGSAREKTSAAFIWATISRLYGARSAQNRQEKMGHVHGGYKAILDAAQRKLICLGVNILLETPATKIEPVYPPHASRDQLRRSALQAAGSGSGSLRLLTNKGEFPFHKILLTTNCPTVMKLVTHASGGDYWNALNRVSYLGIVCLLLVLKRKLSPYYVINLLDKTLPFTGVIEITNIVNPAELDNQHLIFLPKYITPDDPLTSMADKEIRELFLGGLKKVFPDIRCNEITHSRVFREKFVQPLQDVDYLKRAVGFKTPEKNLYLANTSMIYNSTLNNNAVVAMAKKAAHLILSDVGGAGF